VLDAALAFGVDRFVNISTDKAASPSSVLGYSKRIAERLTASTAAEAHRDSGATYLSVRFGNVLGSRGSVLTAFRRQIADGGPVTVTHPDVTRYFMTVEEAVQLVIQAGAIGGRGQVYVLDMGEPVKITDLAETMIRLSGKEPGRDIAIEFVGARPGEKLHEVLWSGTETVSPSTHEGIMLVTRPPIDPVWLEDELDELARLVDAGETLELIGHLSTVAAAPRRNGVVAEAQASETV
jgi:FlaA1/EpsC-like NDP-sugar epimerase